MKTEPKVVASAEPQSLEELYVRHVPAARATAYLLTGDRAMAEDLAQEAFLRLIGRFQHRREPDVVGAYLRRTVVNLCLNHRRRRRVERAYLERERAAVAPSAAAIPDLGTRDELFRALLRLPVRQRAAIVLRYYEDLPEHEVAELMRCSKGAVRSLVFHGLQSLRDSMRGEQG